MKLTKIILGAIGVLILGLAIGRLTASKNNTAVAGDPASPEAAKTTEHTCSMHPQIRQPGPGKCPICAMDLIPVSDAGGDNLGPREIAFTEHARALAQIQTAPVEKRIPVAEIRLFGRVVIDETRMRSITARFPGRIERLYVNYTGVRVNAGDHLTKIYSPDLLTAQAELLSARRFDDPRAVRSSREKLALWGLSEAAISAIEKRGEPSDTMDIDAPLGGIVTEKMVNDGDYVKTGSVLFKIADLSKVWVVLDAYEMDKAWLRFGQAVTFTVEALPGQTLEGRISFIPPILDAMTRTFKVRVNVPNDDMRLRPGMFVTATVQARVAADGVTLDPSLEGKWISPMHPEIVKNGPGQCDICGMDLVSAAELGYASVDDQAMPLVVPASAVLQTGRRALVYVEIPKRDRPTYEGREVVLGPRAGDSYIVRSGLDVGERVVTNGAFKIDSSLQLQAKPSMMSATPSNVMPLIEATPAMRDALGTLVTDYFPVWKALAGDDLIAAQNAGGKLSAATHTFHELEGSKDAQAFLEQTLASVSKEAEAISKAADLTSARVSFEKLSIAIIKAVKEIGLPDDFEVNLAFCPMTFGGRRSDWLQNDKELLNPYFGTAMLKCGEFERLDAALPAASAPARPPAGHQH